MLILDERVINTLNATNSENQKWQLDRLTTGGKIVVFGLSNSGKSTFLNGVINKHMAWPLSTKILPTSRNVCTSFNTEVHFCNIDKIHISINKKIFNKNDYYKPKLIKAEIDENDYQSVTQYLSKHSKEKNIDRNSETDKEYSILKKLEKSKNKYALEFTKNIYIELPNKDISENVIIVDTPGFDSVRDKKMKPETLETIKNSNKAICIIEEGMIRKGSLQNLIEKDVMPDDNSTLQLDAIVNIKKSENIKQNYKDIKGMEYYRKFANIWMMNVQSVMWDIDE
jgi:predicted GTPase